MTEVVTKSSEETELLGEKLGRALTGGEVIAFFGGLGMGKTCFTRGLARGMGLSDAEVSSPTFALVHEHHGVLPLYHFDMYRISTFEDLCSTGFFDYIESGGVLAVEWSENIETALPENNLIKIEFAHADNDCERIITMVGDKKYEDSWN